MIMDHYFYPFDLEATTWTSCVFGYGGVLMAYFGNLYRTQYFAFLENKLGLHRGSIGEQIIDRLHSAYIGFSVVNSWRFLWYWQELYVFPSDRELSAWVSTSVGFVCLMVLFHFKSVYAPPVILLCDDCDVFAPAVAVVSTASPTTASASASASAATSGDCKGDIETGCACPNDTAACDDHNHCDYAIVPTPTPTPTPTGTL